LHSAGSILSITRKIVTVNRIDVPASGRHLVDVLEKNAPHNESKRSTQ
jgi:hypothetical protein